MQSTAEVTIGLCVKNAERTIGRSMESILEQNFPDENMHLIVVDGFSQDRTVQIIRDCLKGRDLEHKILFEKKGLGYARQLVLKESIGNYIIWVDGDVILTKDFVSTQVSFMNTNPRVGIAKGRYVEGSPGEHESIVETLENTEFLLSTSVEGQTGSRSLGTSGCIYRVTALRQVGGFDEELDGVGEDMDMERRVRQADWILSITGAKFYEIRRNSWKSLWDEYFWHGRGGRRLFDKNSQTLNLFKMIPIVALAAEALRVPGAYRLTKRKIVLLLPLHYIFKRVAWLVGFAIG